MPWQAKRRRRVRLHLEVEPHTPVSTLEGLLVSHQGGHYQLAAPKLVQAGGVEHSLESQLVEVPERRVLFVEVIG